MRTDIDPTSWRGLAIRAKAVLAPSPKMCPECGDALERDRIFVLSPGGGSDVTVWDCLNCDYIESCGWKREPDDMIYGRRTRGK